MTAHKAALLTALALSACASGPVTTANRSEGTPTKPGYAYTDPANDGGFWVNGKFYRRDRLPDKKPPRPFTFEWGGA